MKIDTFDNWRKVGRFVKKGAKSIGRNTDGVCLFSEDQTIKLLSFPSNLEDKPWLGDEDLSDGKLSEEEIQQLVGYRRMMKERVRIAASNGDKICGSYLALLDSCPMARQIDSDLDYSEDSDDVEIHY
jgi:hypothetical protein